MTVSLTSLQKLVSLNLSTEQMAGVLEVLTVELAPLEALQKEKADRLSKDRARKIRGSIQGNSTEHPRSVPGMSPEIPGLARVEGDINNSSKNLDNPPLSPPCPPEPLHFAEFWDAYPKRSGGNDEGGAAKAFDAAVKRASPEVLISAAKAFAADMQRMGKVGSQYVPKARKWLNDAGWKDYQPKPVPAPPAQVAIACETHEWDAWTKSRGRPWPVTDVRMADGRLVKGWYVPSQWPPGYVLPAADSGDIPDFLNRRRQA